LEVKILGVRVCLRRGIVGGRGWRGLGEWVSGLGRGR